MAGEILQVHALFKLSASLKSKNQTYFARWAARCANLINWQNK